MKKIIALCLIALLCFSFVACADDKGDDLESSSVSDTNNDSNEQTPSDDGQTPSDDGQTPEDGDGENTTPPTIDEVWNDVTPDTGDIDDGYTPRF